MNDNGSTTSVPGNASGGGVQRSGRYTSWCVVLANARAAGLNTECIEALFTTTFRTLMKESA
jgi:hypothetical protein